MDILGIHIGDNRHEAFSRLSFNRNVKTGKNCFYIDENMFDSFRFSITFYYAGEYIERITLSYTQSDKGAEGRTASIEEVIKKVCEYFNSNLGLPISKDKTEKGGNAVWSDLNITVDYFYQMRNGIVKYLEHSRDTNCVIIQIKDFASHIKDDEFKKIFLQVRKNERIANQGRKRVFIKTKLTFQYAKYILLTIIVLACMSIYAFSHRYQVVYNGRGIIDKWTGTVEEVKYKK